MLTLDRVYSAARVLKEIIRETDMIYAPNISSSAKQRHTLCIWSKVLRMT